MLDMLLDSLNGLTVDLKPKDMIHLVEKIDVTTGVSPENFVMNFQSLLQLGRATFKSNEHVQTVYFLCNIIIAWFWSCGVNLATLKSLTTLKYPESNTFSVLEKVSRSLVSEPTLYPLPSFINTQLKMHSVSNVHLFGNSREDCFFTFQVRLHEQQNNENIPIG
jgi:hypothetical protein